MVDERSASGTLSRAGGASPEWRERPLPFASNFTRHDLAELLERLTESDREPRLSLAA